MHISGNIREAFHLLIDGCTFIVNTLSVLEYFGRYCLELIECLEDLLAAYILLLHRVTNRSFLLENPPGLLDYLFKLIKGTARVLCHPINRGFDLLQRIRDGFCLNTSILSELSDFIGYDCESLPVSPA
jgi:hypothetical protein